MKETFNIDIDNLPDHFIIEFNIEFKLQNINFCFIEICNKIIDDVYFDDIFFNIFDLEMLFSLIDSIKRSDICLNEKIDSIVDVILLNFEFFNEDIIANITESIFFDGINEDIIDYLNDDVILNLNVVQDNNTIRSKLKNISYLDKHVSGMAMIQNNKC